MTTFLTNPRNAPPTKPHLDTKPTRAEVVAAIVAETGCSETGACLLDGYLARVATECLTTSDWHVVPEVEHRNLHHLMDQVMPDTAPGAVVTIPRGSAHDLLNRHHLPAGVAFEHGKVQIELEDKCGMRTTSWFRIN